MQGNQVNLALKRWDTLLTLLPPESQQAKVVKTLIERTRGGGAGSAEGETAGAPEGESAVAAAKAPASNSGDAGASRVVVEVSLAEELASGLSGGETVFVFARAAQGTRMPAAIVRVPVSELPTIIELSDDNSIMPTAKLSLLEQVIVGARVSLSGDATPKSGDLQGISEPIAVGPETKLKIVIDEKIP